MNIEKIKSYIHEIKSYAAERYEETRKLVGINCYASGYELGYIDSLEEVLEYIIAEERINEK